MQTNISNGTVKEYDNRLKIKIKFENSDELNKFSNDRVKENKIMAIGTW
jgi:hypothetical protein